MIKSFEEFAGKSLNESLSGQVKMAIKKVDKEGGNAENLRGYGLIELASQLDDYHGFSKGENIYTKKTMGLFADFIASMTSDEIRNNQA